MPFGQYKVNDISIHALREEGDFITATMRTGIGKFLSTPSARRATIIQDYVLEGKKISIHALREEGDFLWQEGQAHWSDFYPRPPRGGRPG